jgi:dTDP-4-dehydrorhamnose reductase
MVVLLGSTGYVGQAFARQLEASGIPYLAPGHGELDLTSREAVAAWFSGRAVTFVINAVGFTGRPNIDGTERERWRCLRANTVVPGVLAEVLGDRGIEWGHVSSGCIYRGARLDGSGFTEEDEPVFAMTDPRAGWYARTKWMAEVLLRERPGVRIWRMRIPFDEEDHERNYLSKLMRYEKLLEVRNSISHRQEFAAAAIATLMKGLPGGVYNVTNPGSVLTSEVVEALRRHGICRREFEYFSDERAFLAEPGRVYRASCILDSGKLAAAGIVLRDVRESLEATLYGWKPA